MDDIQQYHAAASKLMSGDDAPIQNPLFNLGHDLLSEFAEADLMRRDKELRWLEDLRQYKGIYEPDEEAKMRGSKAFMRKTRVKVESVDARMMDLLFPANRERNYDIASTPNPSVPDEVRKAIINALMMQMGQYPARQDIDAAIKAHVDEAALRMADRIDDQLTEAHYRNISREVMHSGHLYGTGILKGPQVERRQRTRFVWENGQYVQRTEVFAAPFIAHVPVWRWYPDQTVTDLRYCRYVWEHHRLGRPLLAELAERKSFDGAKIREYINANVDGAIKVMNYEQELRSMKDRSTSNLIDTKAGQYDVYERTGWLSGDKLRSCGIEIADDRLHEAHFANLWILPDGQVIKAVLMPADSERYPYHLYYFEKDETSIFGDGIPAVMRDDQKMINAVGRMILDNAAMTAIPQFEVFVPAFPVSADLQSMYPGKIWPRVTGDFGAPAIRQLKFDSNLNQLSPIFQMFDNNADETTAIPKFTYGDNPSSGAAATMGGLSMLMAQANIALKDMVISYDEGVTKPFIEQLYHWNMKYSSDNTIKGDFDVHARGASSLVAKEVRANMLSQYAATMQPEERMFIDWEKLSRQRAESSDLGDILKTKEQVEQAMQDPAMAQEQQMAQMQAQLTLAMLKAKTAEHEARASKTHADALSTRVEAIYAAMQAAGVAASNPNIAPAGDAILKSSGWKDATPDDPGSGAEQAEGGASVPEPGSPNTGRRAGMRTEELG